MTRICYCVVVMLIAATLYTPLSASKAYASGAPALSTDEIKSAFVSRGYQVTDPSAWSDSVAMLGVYDGSTDRPGWPVLRVFVFADANAAEIARHQAYAGEQALPGRSVGSRTEGGPRLLAGYGSSVWLRNIAVVSLSDIGDAAAFPQAPDCAPDAVVTEHGRFDPSSTAVGQAVQTASPIHLIAATDLLS